jgi:hypothetical protein
MELKKCPHCNKNVLAISKACKHCGKSFEQELPVSNETIVSEDNVKDNNSNITQPDIENQLESEVPTKNYNTGIIVGLIIFLLLIIIAIVSNRTIKPENPISKLDSTAIVVDTVSPIVQNVEQIEEKYLITNNSVGLFNIDGSWQNYAKKDYNYLYVQGYANCVDASCDGGFDLGNNLVDSENGQKIENIELTIGAALFEASESNDIEVESSKYKDNPNVFFISSDNSCGWYLKDRISYLVLFSNKFKTKEGIGVDTNLEKVQEIFGDVVINIGWIEEDANAVQFKIDSYPNIEFILDGNDAVGGYNFLSTHEGQTIKVSDFKENTKIKRLIISKN